MIAVTNVITNVITATVTVGTTTVTREFPVGQEAEARAWASSSASALAALAGPIANLTQHRASPDQITEEVFDLPGGQPATLLTFAGLPTGQEVRRRAETLAEVAKATGARRAMVGGYLALMAPLCAELAARGITPLFAHSERETVEEVLPDGSVRKTQIFRHAGFVPAIF
jgi:hypothetical protein